MKTLVIPLLFFTQFQLTSLQQCLNHWHEYQFLRQYVDDKGFEDPNFVVIDNLMNAEIEKLEDNYRYAPQAEYRLQLGIHVMKFWIDVCERVKS